MVIDCAVPDTTFVYALCEPDTGEVRYVGKANNPKQRVWDHLKERRHTHKNNWINSLKRRGLRPKLELLLEVSRDEWEYWEREMIVLFRAEGRLVNATSGGESGVGGNNRGKPMHPNTRAALQTYNANKKISLETRARMSESAKRRPANFKKGSKHSEETKQKISASKTGKCSGENGSFFGKKHSPEALEKMRVSSLGRQTFTGCRHSEESKEKMSQAQRKNWAKRKSSKTPLTVF